MNEAGWLIDDEGNIINNLGQVKLIKAQLRGNGQFPKLLNYDGSEYDIRSIMGTYEKDHQSKEMKLCAKEDKSYQPKRNNINIT